MYSKNSAWLPHMRFACRACCGRAADALLPHALPNQPTACRLIEVVCLDQHMQFYREAWALLKTEAHPWCQHAIGDEAAERCGQPRHSGGAWAPGTEV